MRLVNASFAVSGFLIYNIDMYEDIKQQYKDLETELMDPVLQADRQKLTATAKKHAELKRAVDLITQLEKNQAAITDNEAILSDEKDETLRAMAGEENEQLTKENEKLETSIKEELFPANPLDKKNVIVEIRAGTGGDESALFAAELFRMYSRFAEKQGWKIDILDSNRIGLGGYKEIIFSVEGTSVYGLMKYEGGTHRVQRVPETEKAGRIHTSAVTVAVFPEAEEIDVEIKPSDIRIDTFCSSGPGGQSVNTTYSAIRILHIPTGMIVSCQDQKSQHQNKEKALQVLRSRLLQKAEDERREKESAARKEQVGSGDRSDKIRTYNFPQDRVTDHRLKESWHSINLIMEGELEEIIYALKNYFTAQHQTSA